VDILALLVIPELLDTVVLAHQVIPEPVDIQASAGFPESVDLAVKADIQVFPEAVCQAILVRQAFQVILDTAELWVLQGIPVYLAIQVFLAFLDFLAQAGFLASLDTQDRAQAAFLDTLGTQVAACPVLAATAAFQASQVRQDIAGTRVLWVLAAHKVTGVLFGTQQLKQRL
tara:strand:- start:1673 stop:2188 length:516 start_codon:yes stop_codon:yes gene_type:complete